MLFSTKLKKQIEELTENAAKAEARAAEAESKLAEIEGKLKAAEEENGRLDADLGAKAEALEAAQKENETLKADLKATQAKLAEREKDVKNAFAGELKRKDTAEAIEGTAEGHPEALPENGAETGAETWADALKAEGGDYAKARQLHRAAFAAAFPGVAKNLESKNGD